MSYLGDLGLQVAGSAVNSVGSLLGLKTQAKASKDLMDYQFKNYTSPQAQVKNLAAAGINPATAFGNQAPVIGSAPEGGSLGMPQFGIGTTSMTDLANYIKALSDAKKNGANTKVLEQEAEMKRIETDRQDFELQLRRTFGVKSAFAELSTAFANLRLAKLSGDRAEIQKETDKWIQAKEKALSETAEAQKGIMQKTLDNTDKRLELENEVIRQQGKTEVSKQAANYAGARSSDASAEQFKSQASVNRQIERIQHVFADVEESGKTEKIATLLNHYKTAQMIDDKDYEEAHRMYERLKTINKDNDSSKWNRYADAIMFYLEEHIHGLSPFTGLVK